MAKAAAAKTVSLTSILRRLQQPQFKVPPREPEESALERLLALTLQGESPYSVARKAVKGLLRSYAHWNEVRVARRYEVREILQRKRVAAAEERSEKVQELLRRVFGLQNHLELDWLYDATSERRDKLLSSLTMTPPHSGPVLDLDAAMADPDEKVPPITTDLKRLLARLGMVPSNPKDVEVLEVVQSALAEERLYPNYLALHVHARDVCESKHPRCRQCPVLDACPHGRRGLGAAGFQAALEELGLPGAKQAATAARRGAAKKRARRSTTRRKAPRGSAASSRRGIGTRARRR